jgi:hypothetical protein
VLAILDAKRDIIPSKETVKIDMATSVSTRVNPFPDLLNFLKETFIVV